MGILQRESHSEKTQQGERRAVPTDLVTALAGFIFLLTLSIVLVLNLRVLYYHDIEALDLAQMTGYTGATIRRNYDTLIDYNLISKGMETLEFPDFPMSEHGRIHFEEVKQIFVAIQYGCIVSGVLFLILMAWRLKRRDYVWLKLTSVLTLVIPSGIGLLVVICWEKVFVVFHKLFFRNDYWLFDPATDPVINILPDEFFFHCAAVIVLFLIAGSLLCGLAYRMLRRSFGRH